MKSMRLWLFLLLIALIVFVVPANAVQVVASDTVICQDTDTTTLTSYGSGWYDTTSSCTLTKNITGTIRLKNDLSKSNTPNGIPDSRIYVTSGTSITSATTYTLVGTSATPTFNVTGTWASGTVFTVQLNRYTATSGDYTAGNLRLMYDYGYDLPYIKVGGSLSYWNANGTYSNTTYQRNTNNISASWIQGDYWSYWNTRFLTGYVNLYDENTTSAKDFVLYGSPNWTTDVWGSALNFDGVNDYGTVTTSNYSNPNILTITGWINYSSNGEGERIFNFPGYILFIHTDNKMYFQDVRDAGDNPQWSMNNTLTPGVPFNFSVQYNFSSSAPYILKINGTNQPVSMSGSLTGNHATNVGTGYLGDNGALTRRFKGNMGRLAIYNRNLTSSEIEQALNAQLVPSGNYTTGVMYNSVDTIASNYYFYGNSSENISIYINSSRDNITWYGESLLVSNPDNQTSGDIPIYHQKQYIKLRFQINSDDYNSSIINSVYIYYSPYVIVSPFLAKWDIDNNAGLNIFDSSGSNLKMYLNNPNWQNESMCKSEGCLLFNSTIIATTNITSSPNMGNTNLSNNFTIGLRHYVLNNQSGNILNKSSSTSGYVLNYSSGKIIFNGLNGSLNANPNMTVNNNSWYISFITFLDGNATLYDVNGSGVFEISSVNISESLLNTSNNIQIGSGDFILDWIYIWGSVITPETMNYYTNQSLLYQASTVGVNSKHTGMHFQDTDYTDIYLKWTQVYDTMGSQDVIAGDIDNDGYLEAVYSMVGGAGNENPTRSDMPSVMVLDQNGTIKWNITEDWIKFISSGDVISDLNNDGESELITIIDGQVSGTQRIIVVDGNGTEVSWFDNYIADDYVDWNQYSAVVKDAVGLGTKQIYFSDANYHYRSVDFDGTLLWTYDYGCCDWGFASSGSVVEDFDNDGFYEVVFGTDNNLSGFPPYTGRLIALNATTGGLINTTVLNATGINTRPRTIFGVNDIDADGILEIIVGDQNSTLYAYNFTGRVLNKEWEVRVSSGGMFFPYHFSIGDLDYDGLSEIVVADTTGYLSVVNSSGVITDTKQTIPPTESCWEDGEWVCGNASTFSGVNLIDTNHDNLLEIIVNFNRNIYHVDNNLNELQNITLTPNNETTFVKNLVVADFDNDKTIDILAATGDMSQVSKNHTYFMLSFQEATPPDSITDINMETGNFFINNTWTEPTDIDLNYTIFKYVNETIIQNVSAGTEYLNITYSPHYEQNISAQTCDTSGNCNSTKAWFNGTIPNNVPVLANIGNINAVEGDTIDFTMVTMDADNDTITNTSNATEGTFTAATGNYNWVTIVGDAGTYIWNFSVSDGYGGTDIEVITVTVSEAIKYPNPVTSLSCVGYANYSVFCSWQAVQP